jgi:hypothetical protein
LKILFSTCGIFLAGVRLREPYVFKHFKQDILKMKNNRKFAYEPLCAFANSAMNIEFVYIILLGVNNFMQSKEYLPNKSSIKLAITKNDRSTVLTYCGIKVEDIANWDV